MSERANQLHATTDRQIGELLDLITTLDEDTSRRRCPGRDKLGDGTVAANAGHTADNYERIANFLTTNRRGSTAHGPRAGGHNALYTADNTDLSSTRSHPRTASGSATGDAPSNRSSQVSSSIRSISSTPSTPPSGDAGQPALQ